MTVASFVQTPPYLVEGIGPYEISCPYTEGAIIASVLIDGRPVTLDPDQVTIEPVASDAMGSLYLSADLAAEHAGRTIWIDRVTEPVQGWEARYGDREVGMERQLDRDTMAIQELRAELGATLRGRAAAEPYSPTPGRVPIFRADGTGWEDGPDSDAIYQAADNAEQALQARIAAEAAAEAAQAASDGITKLAPNVSRFTADGLSRQFIVPGIFESTKYLLLWIGGEAQARDRFTVVPNYAASETLITWLGRTWASGEMIPKGWLVEWQAQFQVAVQIGEQPWAFATRARFVTAVAGGFEVAAGTVVVAAGLSYVADPDSTVLPGLPGWRPAGLITTRHFGAQADDGSTAALQAALNSGLPMLHDIYCTASARLTRTGPLTIHGIGKGQCGIRWTNGGADEGIQVTRASWNDVVIIEGMDLVPSGAGLATAIEIDNDPIIGITTGRSYFDTRTRIHRNRLGLGLGLPHGWKCGVLCRFPFATEVCENEIYGKALPGALIEGDFIADSVGIYVPDQSVRTIANFVMTRNVIMGFRHGALIYNNEGSPTFGNDLQVCYDGFEFRNTITKINQYRLYANHIGVSGCQARFVNVRQVLLEGNEISYRNGRTDGATVGLIEMDAVYSANIIGNSIRGNVQNDTDIIVDGIVYLWTAGTSAADVNRRIVVSGNTFQNLRHAERNDAGTNTRFTQRVSNSYDGIRGQRLVVGDAGANFAGTMYIGAGNFESFDYSSSNTAVVIKQIGAAALSVERQNTDGVVVSIHRNGTSVGSISTTATATAFNTASDAALKEPVSVLTRAEAMATLRRIIIRYFVWRVNGEAGYGAFAQELYDVVPEAVTPGVGSPGDAEYVPWMVDYSKIIPLLIVAVAGDEEGE